MKKVLLLTLIIGCFLSCSKPTKEDMAKDLIKKYMIENLNDPKSYEPISFSKLDSISVVHPVLLGWRMTHKFRAKNGFGALGIQNMEFFFDKEVTKIDNAGNL